MTIFEKTKKLDYLRELFPNAVVVTATQCNHNGDNAILFPESRNKHGLDIDIIYVDYINLLKPKITENNGN